MFERRHRLRMLFASLALALACAHMATLRDDPALSTTLRVTNSTGGPVTVYLGGIKVGRAPTGVTCIHVSGPNRHRSMPLAFRLLADRTYFAPSQQLSVADGWAIRVGRAPRIDLQSLRPAPRC